MRFVGIIPSWHLKHKKRYFISVNKNIINWSALSFKGINLPNQVDSFATYILLRTESSCFIWSLKTRLSNLLEAVRGNSETILTKLTCRFIQEINKCQPTEDDRNKLIKIREIKLKHNHYIFSPLNQRRKILRGKP